MWRFIRKHKITSAIIVIVATNAYDEAVAEAMKQKLGRDVVKECRAEAYEKWHREYKAKSAGQ
jgi:hypothetical protein